MIDVERVFLTDPDDPKIREITIRMSRFACNLESEEERYKEKAYIVETNVPIILKGYAPYNVTSEKYVYITPKPQKSGSRIFIVPGVMALVMYINTIPIDEETAKIATDFALNYFTSRIIRIIFRQ